MKIFRFFAENIKKLQVVEIEPSGAIVRITGRNGAGKSSVIDAIYYALVGGKAFPDKPVRRGTKTAMVKLDLGEVTVTRKIHEDGKTSLTVEAQNGARFPSPQKMLDDLVGSLTFDPFAFSRMPPKEQLAQLKKMVQLDVDIDALDGENARQFEQRTEVNRKVKALRAQLDALPVHEDLPDDAIDISELLEKMQAAGEHNARVATFVSDRAGAGLQVKSELQRMEQRRLEAKVLRQKADAMEAEADQMFERAQDLMKAWAETKEPEPIDTDELRHQIERAREVNAAIDERSRRVELEAELTDAEGESKDFTEAMEYREQQKRDALAAAKMPVDGLSFGDGMVTLNGLPFEQASSAEQLRTSVAIAMAANPKLRVLRIQDGSLLDEDSLLMIAHMARDNDYQVWIEQVNTTGKVGIVLEDGMVVATHEYDTDVPQEPLTTHTE